MKSIRIYLLLVLLSVICLSNFLAALQGYRTSLRAADKLIDQQISEKARLLSSLITQRHDLPANLYGDNTLFQVWQGKQLLARSTNAPSQRLVISNNISLDSALTDNGYHFVSHAGTRWRTWVYNASENSDVVIVGERFDIYSKLTEKIILAAILPIIWVLPVVGILVWLIISWGLGPLTHLAKSLNKRGVDDFTPIALKQYPDEMKAIVSSLNQLFRRLTEAFERERHFSANAAHELRTPLAALKVSIHNLSESIPNNFSNTMEIARSFAQLKISADKMGHSIEQMLTLHRVSSEELSAAMDECDLGLIAKNVIAECYEKLNSKHQSIELKAKSGTMIGDHFLLAILLSNLIDNASKYSPEYGNIGVTIKYTQAGISLLVEDSGPGIPESEYAQVINRFYRIGGDRHTSGVAGSGLGLSIVAHIVQLHQGKLFFSRSEKLGGLAVEVNFSADCERATYED